MPSADPAIIKNPDRVEALNRLHLLDAPTERAFDRLTELASKIIKAPITLVSLVDADRQFIKSHAGLDVTGVQELPLSHSLCQHVVATSQPLIVEDAREHPLVYDNLAITELNVIAYLGMPITIYGDTDLGSFCAVDHKPRVWTEWEIEVMRELAASVITEIELRAELLARQEAEQRLDERNRKLNRVTAFCRVTIDHMYNVLERDASKAEMLDYLQSAKTQLDRQL